MVLQTTRSGRYRKHITRLTTCPKNLQVKAMPVILRNGGKMKKWSVLVLFVALCNFGCAIKMVSYSPAILMEGTGRLVAIPSG